MIHPSALLVIAAVALPTAAGAANYTARPIAPVAEKRIVGRDISWACGAAACTGTTEDSRPLVLCQGLVKQAGRLASFTVDGRAFGVADLDKCNAMARGGAATAPVRD